jgi:metal-responsive CopG/Arc/MetJ family transcriptional regulator
MVREGGKQMHGQLTIRLTPDLEESISSLAQRLQRKRSEIVRLALQRFILEECVAEEPAPYERVKNLIGVVETGCSDLGENHREHLKIRFRRDG